MKKTEYNAYYIVRNPRNNFMFITCLEEMINHLNENLGFKIKREKDALKLDLIYKGKKEGEILANKIYTKTGSYLDKKLDGFKPKCKTYEVNILEGLNDKYEKSMISRGFIHRLCEENFNLMSSKKHYLIADKKNKIVGDFCDGIIRFESDYAPLNIILDKYYN